MKCLTSCWEDSFDIAQYGHDDHDEEQHGHNHDDEQHGHDDHDEEEPEDLEDPEDPHHPDQPEHFASAPDHLGVLQLVHLARLLML